MQEAAGEEGAQSPPLSALVGWNCLLDLFLLPGQVSAQMNEHFPEVPRAAAQNQVPISLCAPTSEPEAAGHTHTVL